MTAKELATRPSLREKSGKVLQKLPIPLMPVIFLMRILFSNLTSKLQLTLQFQKPLTDNAHAKNTENRTILYIIKDSSLKKLLSSIQIFKTNNGCTV